MGFNAVFGCLKEVFPQVDFRILKAIAIEHPFDADAAVLDVINEFPNLATQSFSSAVSPTQVQIPKALPVTAQHKDKGKLLMHQQVIHEAEFEPLPEPEKAAVDDDSKNDHTSGISHDNPTLLEQVNSLPNGPVPSDADIGTGSEEVISDGKGLNFDVQVGLQQSASGITTLSMPGKDVMNGTLVDAFPEWKSFYLPVNCDSDLVLHDTRDKVEPFAVDSSFIEHSLDAPQCDIPCSDPLLANDNLQATDPSDHTPEKECSPREMVDIEETTTESICNTDVLEEIIEDAKNPSDHTSEKECSPREMVDIEETMTESVCNTDVLEEIIEDAKNNKKTLFSAMESVISMMREVEVQEKEVDIVQEEASRGGLDIMVKVEELKQMLAHAKDGNDMHAGEVYGEKAILATEVRELQSRLLNLSDERDKSLAILNEMRETLEERLDAAAEARRLAEQDKLEKEECARKALAEQEAEMEKVVQESKILQQEAEENSKLREFLMDRGRIVDMLQGEISVICQDVRLLKEKFDERVPLSQSVSSSQTSCILASSGSSMKSVALDLVSERLELLKSPEKVSPASSVDGLSPKSILEQERRKADRKELMDDGWDVFDKEFGV